MHGQITHADVTHVMGTLVEPTVVNEHTYQHGQYVYLHPHAIEHNDLAVEEVMIEEVIDLDHIVVRYCNSETMTTVSCRRLSAPIYV
jgi:hypothetical protein